MRDSQSRCQQHLSDAIGISRYQRAPAKSARQYLTVSRSITAPSPLFHSLRPPTPRATLSKAQQVSSQRGWIRSLRLYLHLQKRRRQCKSYPQALALYWLWSFRHPQLSTTLLSGRHNKVAKPNLRIKHSSNATVVPSARLHRRKVERFWLRVDFSS